MILHHLKYTVFGIGQCKLNYIFNVSKKKIAMQVMSSPRKLTVKSLNVAEIIRKIYCDLSILYIFKNFLKKKKKKRKEK